MSTSPGASADAILRECYNLDTLLIEQALPVPAPTLAPDLWHCPHCLLPVSEYLGAISGHLKHCEALV